MQEHQITGVSWAFRICNDEYVSNIQAVGEAWKYGGMSFARNNDIREFILTH